MTLGNQIAQLRKNLNITQDALAQRLGVTNQAVSKWESDQCCPDVMLLPKLADIFDVSIDVLFGRAPQAAPVQVTGLPWPNDETLRVVVYMGHTLVGNSRETEKLTFQYEGPALNIDSQVSVSCGDVAGNVDAGGSVACANVEGSVDAGGSVTCGNVGQDVDAGGHVKCECVGGDVDAGGNVTCANVGGDVDAGDNVTCQEVRGNIDAGNKVIIQK